MPKLLRLLLEYSVTVILAIAVGVLLGIAFSGCAEIEMMPPSVLDPEEICTCADLDLSQWILVPLYDIDLNRTENINSL